jgi:F0F1-type ATP synthase assembly protein I
MQPRQRRWTRRLAVLVISGGLVGACLGFLASTLIVPGFDASAFLLVTPSGGTPVETNQVQYAQAISQVITNPAVLAPTGSTAEPAPDPRHVRADPSPNAPLIEVIANATTADEARRRAQAAAEAVVAYTADRANQLGVQAVVLAPAGGGKRAGLSLAAYLAAGAAMGAVLGALLAMLLGEPATAEPSLPIADDATTAEPLAPSSDDEAGDRRPSVTTAAPS